ncbi:MAG: hypothetical protein PWR03_1139 [Tenuifilum sp.]|jgi:hypothetical protein|uniref:hypothetical protein n=1 Tax=Tenuifilum sp. TaxID=2760880 RepID=UPI0024AA26FD|nr:hypothetical protein [Tenuifilum sp.]MDI3526956.1 hypothetical protein [Tenuifilum sp.]
MKRLLLLFFIGTSLWANAQTDSTGYSLNTVSKMLKGKPGLQIGGYGEVHYNQPIESNTYKLGTVDAHRLIMFLGYNFSEKTQFISEIEFEHADEIWVEQMFIQHKLNKSINLRAGVLIIPMGIINEYHEPTAFNGVERPTIDSKINPSTWREVGFGVQGNIFKAKTRYQLYVVNGLNGYDDTGGLFSGSSGLRSGRQKASKAYVHSPAFTGKIEYYGLKNLNIGVSGYFGKSNSKLFADIDKNDNQMVNKADSSTVGISMLGFDARYTLNSLILKGQAYIVSLSNTEEYNKFTGTPTTPNDLGNKMLGYYVELGYDVFKSSSKNRMRLIPFVRYEQYDTHFSTDNSITKNDSYNNTIITTGISYFLTNGVVLKSDVQFMKSSNADKYSKIINAGFGFNF